MERGVDRAARRTSWMTKLRKAAFPEWDYTMQDPVRSHSSSSGISLGSCAQPPTFACPRFQRSRETWQAIFAVGCVARRGEDRAARQERGRERGARKSGGRDATWPRAHQALKIVEPPELALSV